MTWLAETCMLSFGWRRALILICAGALAAASMPPFFILPALFIGLPVLVWCLDGAEYVPGWRRILGPAFRIGFFFGLGYFTVAIHWVGAAFFVDGGWVLGAMPFAVLGLAAILAVFWGLAAALAHVFWSGGALRIVALAAALTVAEFARGHLFSGFPFDLLGYALTANDQMSQLAAVIGVYGLTAIAATIGALPALIWPADERALTRRLVPFFTIVAVLAAQVGYGQYRLNTVTVPDDQDVILRLVQPDIDQAMKWRTDSRDFIMERLLSLSETKLGPDDEGLAGIDQLVWPESAMPFFLADQPEDLARIARLLPPGKQLITGAPRQDFTTGAAYNAVMIINSDGEVVDSYDKTHLVPFGEYLPFARAWAQVGLRQFVPGQAGWSHGERRRVLEGGGHPGFLPLVCYEAVFSGDLGAALDEAGYILNLTNDGWFDGSVGPAQHFHHVRLRAIEEGRSLVRLANTGVTALVDPLGRVTASLGRETVGVLDVSPPAPLAGTPFARWRHWPLLGVLVLGFAVMLLEKRILRR